MEVDRYMQLVQSIEYKKMQLKSDTFQTLQEKIKSSMGSRDGHSHIRIDEDYTQESSLRGRSKSIVPIPRRAGGIMMRDQGQGLPMRQRRLSNFRLPSLRRSKLSRNSRSLGSSEYDEEEQ